MNKFVKNHKTPTIPRPNPTTKFATQNMNDARVLNTIKSILHNNSSALNPAMNSSIYGHVNHSIFQEQWLKSWKMRATKSHCNNYKDQHAFNP